MPAAPGDPLAQTPDAPADGTWLLACAIGPVKDFVAAGRRMRDFHMGSRLLSMLNLAALAQAERIGATVVFPTWSGAALPVGGATVGLPNRGLVHVGKGLGPQAVADAMRQAAQARLRRVAAGVGKAFKPGDIDDAQWKFQLGELVDLQVAWVRCHAEEGDDDAWRDDCRRALRALTARRRSPLFSAQSPYAVAELPVASIGGRWPSVLTRTYLRDEAERQRRLGIDGDALDALGVIKRMLDRGERFPAISRIAVQPWVAELAEMHPQRLEEITRCCEQVRRCAPELVAASRGHGGMMPFDAELLLPGRAMQAARLVVGREDAQQGLEALEAAILGARQALGHAPWPYVALLQVDLDRFGETLWTAARGRQVELSQRAAAFAQSCQRLTVEYGGVALYAGGDEALLVVPARPALRLAEALHAEWWRPVGGVAPTTVSVGIALGHALTPLSALREQARRAIELAKAGPERPSAPRDALAVVAKPRGGVELIVRLPWRGEDDSEEALPVQRMLRWMKAFDDGTLARGSPYRLAAEVGRLGAAKARLQRILDRMAKVQGAAGQPAAWRAWANEVVGDRRLPDPAAQLVAEWRVARWLREEMA